MRTRISWLTVITLLLVTIVHAEDWPAYRHDNQRSGVTAEALDAKALKQAWAFESPHPPQPAWPGPAKWDAYARIIGLRAMRNYDPVFHPVIAGDTLYFGSSVEDCLYALDTKDGAQKWVYFADGPIRLAPTCDAGRVYFGSDDGHAYCLDGTDASLIWKFSPADDPRLIPNNGKLISLNPCRTGVLVDAGKAYFAASLLPWRQTFLCAINAETGSPEGETCYVQAHERITMEGALLASNTKIYAPQGRSAPLVFDRANGAALGGLEGGGGVFAVLTPDMHIFHGPGNKTGWITESNAETREKIATFEGGKALVINGNSAYVLKDEELTAIDRTSGKPRWTVPSDTPHTIILAGDTLYAGGTGFVRAYNAADGERTWSHDISGRAHGLAAANGALYASTDTGCIHCFR